MKKIKLPEPKVLKELHAIRRKIQRVAEKAGWEKYLADLNQRPSLLGQQRNRGAAVVRERPAKYKAR
ncbi:MAG: hypothetical protein HY360_13585 [Verrucomicrobia bacterium]|nr:hypothetical protein [Verrucomicrobiota bacterium]